MAQRAVIALALVALLAAPAMAQQKEKAKPAAPADNSVGACPAGASSKDDPIIACVDGVTLHRSEFAEWIKGLPAQYQQKPQEQLYNAYLHNWVPEQLLAEAAKKANIGSEPDVKRELARQQTSTYAKAYAERLAKKDVSDAALKTAYDEYAKGAGTGEEVCARHILVPTEDEAKGVIADLKKGADFATLAGQKTTDPSGKTAGGDLGCFRKEDMVPEFSDAAFAMKKGDYSQTPVKTQFGYHVIKVEDRRPAKPKTFEEVKPQLTHAVQQHAVDEKVQELIKAGKIKVFALDGSELPPPTPASAAAPAGAPAGAAADPAAAAPKLSPATAPDQLQSK